MKNFYVSTLCDETVIVNGKKETKPILKTCRTRAEAEMVASRWPYLKGARFAYIFTADRARRLTCVDAFDNYPGAKKATRTATNQKIGETRWALNDFMRA